MTASERPSGRTATPLLALLLAASTAHAGLRPLDDEALSGSHAAGLPEPALRQIEQGLPLGGFELPAATAALPELAGHALERQQALAQVKLATAMAQSSVDLMRVAALPALATPLAPLFIPALLVPFPFLALPPIKKDDGGH